MMGDLSEDQFDAILVGTGIQESAIASGLCLTGKCCLHLDDVRAWQCGTRMRVGVRLE